MKCEQVVCVLVWSGSSGVLLSNSRSTVCCCTADAQRSTAFINGLLAHIQARDLQPSPEALEQSDAYKRRPAPSRARSAERVREETKDRVVASGGDPGNARLVPSESTVQFGQYRGQTFKWLLTHDVGYAVMVLAARQRECEGGATSMYPAMANKDALVQYASAGPGTGPPLLDGRTSVSWLRGTPERFVWGPVRGYVRWIRRQNVSPASKMEALQKSIQRRDAKESGRPQTRSATASPSVPARAPAPHLSGVSGRRSSTASCSASEGSGARPASEGSRVRLLSVELARPETTQEPSDADLLACPWNWTLKVSCPAEWTE
ncbi:uncharacterized protein LOC118240668 [Electrophorus electricus]|uniref:uncharacterized protein LOC118240668 n=1 Tax=Electrophorus electricus TaxID=8005 RepID=UPI0015CFC773|nr:uncharacterized protein LOC118240668 [Electrophorus electricus]